MRLGGNEFAHGILDDEGKFVAVLDYAGGIEGVDFAPSDAPERRVLEKAGELAAALQRLMSNPYVHLMNLVYVVREREGFGWDGPAVTDWSEAVEKAQALMKELKLTT